MNFTLFRFFALAGTSLVIVPIIYSVLLYRGKRKERFSLFNHFISELGEKGVSRGAWAFNAGLFLGGLFLLPYIIAVGFALHSILGWLGMAAGVVATLGVSAVGLFPMNNLSAHTKAALTYFRAGLLMVVLTGLAIQFQPAGQTVIPRWANLLSLLAAAAYASFLFLPVLHKTGPRVKDMLDPEIVPERPRFWLLPFLEWLVFFTTMLWLFGMAFFL